MTDQKLLYYSPSASGGLADYARYQANALASLGIQVDMLTSKDFAEHPGDRFRRLALLPEGITLKRRTISRLATAHRILAKSTALAKVIESGEYQTVLLGAYSEYMAPLWTRPLLRLARQGVVFGTVVHDPVRDYVVGPKWWHRWSVACAYSLLREAFVHEAVVLDTVRYFPKLRTTVVPHGLFAFTSTTGKSLSAVRAELNVPESATLWLSFGHIRDGKNLDLAIRALKEFPECYLLVAGKEQSAGQKPCKTYQMLAQTEGVASRCRWINRFVAESEVAALFEACDIVLLTYSKDFRSASGVLNAAVYFRRRCLASSGHGNLETMVKQFKLGEWVQPDSLDALVGGLRHLSELRIKPDWEHYESENNWGRNAELVAQHMFEKNDFSVITKPCAYA